MHFLNQNITTLVIQGFSNICRLLITSTLIFSCFFTTVNKTYADSKVTLNDQKNEIRRSLETIRDIDYQTWQIIVYPNLKDPKNLILRIVGYPGSLRFDHPTNLVVNSGRKVWDLKDITKNRKTNLEVLNDSVAEFDIAPLINELDRNRPLRFRLPGLINELPIPPYLVREWRSLA